MNVDRVGAARDRVVEGACAEHVVARQGEGSDDAARFANADLGRGRGEPRVREAGHVAPEEGHQLHRLPPALHLGPRQIVGIERIDADDARHVDADLVGIRADEELDQLARHVDLAAFARALPELVQAGDGAERARAAFAGRQAGAHLIGVLADVSRGGGEVDRLSRNIKLAGCTRPAPSPCRNSTPAEAATYASAVASIVTAASYARRPPTVAKDAPRTAPRSSRSASRK